MSAIKAASARTGVDFAYLLNKAEQESGLSPTAKATGSSATGLYQFIDQTWLKTVKTNGEAYGLGDMASKISIGSDGVARVASAADRKAILALRNNPEVSANMAAELAKANQKTLETRVGGDINATDLYMAHFLGSNGASIFLNKLKENPQAKAADILPTAASANRSVFYDKSTGRAKTVDEIYQRFAQKFDKAPDLSEGSTMLAASDKASRAFPSSIATFQTASLVPSNHSTPLLEEETTARTSIAPATSSPPNTNTISYKNGVSVGQSMSSPFATMMMAQMDMDTFALDAKDYTTRMGDNDDERRKSILSTLANAA